MHFEHYDNRPEHFLEFLPTIEWGAGKMLYKTLSEGTFYQRFGESSSLYFLVHSDDNACDSHVNHETPAISQRATAGETSDDRSSEINTNNLHIAGFGAIVEQDFHPVPEWQRWIAFIYVDPRYRGQHLSEKIVRFLEDQIRSLGEKQVHILTQHTGLYEKYGYEFVREEDDGKHDHAYIYAKPL